ncbi:MAG TPA: serine/threonine-protein kinase, partial [Pyrinomonadaceae bacterium]|nr:serine/threonine-protein kinase [Pyrinomonadaceae bacterium]
MNPDRWKSLDDLFHLALECDAESRSAFVLQATAGDNDLRRELEAMLAHHDQAHSFIELPAYAVVGETIIEDDSPEQLIGATLGPYRVLSVLGKGGMGVVYEALDQELRRKVALKFLRPDLTGDRSRVLRFKQEARAASALNHPNILTVFAIGEINDQHYIATELVEGNTLRELIKSESMNLSQIISIASQTASALAAAHAAGIMHRDIKPENIVVRPDGYVKVLDFGLAKLIEPSVTDSELSTFVNTEQGTIIGTIQYMSPEQARG